MQIRSENRDIPIVRNIRALRFPRPFFLEPDGLWLVALQRQPQAFHIQNNGCDIFCHARNRGEFVQHSFDLDGGYRSPRQRRQQHTTLGVPHRGAKSSLKCLGRKSAECRGKSVLVDFHPHGDLKVFHRFNHDSPFINSCVPIYRSAMTG